MVYAYNERLATLASGEEISYRYLKTSRHIRLDDDGELVKSYLLFSREPSSDKEIELPPLELAIHPNTSGKIVIASPGAHNPIDGFSEGFGYNIQQSDLGAAVRTANRFPSNLKNQLDDNFRRFCGKVIKDTIRGAIGYSLKHAEEISGSRKPEIYLVGYSAGGGGVAAVAHEFPQVKKVLLMAPSYDTREDGFNGIKQFAGDLCIISGKNDEAFTKLSRKYHYLATKTSSRKLVLIPDCGHQFEGEENRRIWDRAPFWAFGKSSLQQE